MSKGRADCQLVKLQIILVEVIPLESQSYLKMKELLSDSTSNHAVRLNDELNRIKLIK